MKYLLSFILSILCLNENYAQVTIRGQVKDKSGKSISFCSITLLHEKDSALLKGNLTNDQGEYMIENVDPGKYLILASYLGYEPVYSTIIDIKSESKMATVDIMLQEKSIVLDEAVFIAKRPFLEQKADRLIVNVSNSAIAAGGTAMEILKKVPGVIIIQDKVTLGGSQNVQVWIDGKPSPYTDMNAVLRDMPGDQIDRIELITQPGAQFDAAGGPILNVILKRNADLGFKATAALAVGGYQVDQGDVDQGVQNYYRINPSVNVAYRKGKYNLFGNASFNQGKTFEVFIVDRFIGSDVYKSKSLDNKDYQFRNIRIGADYYATKKTTIGFIARAWGRNGDGNSYNRTNVFDLSDHLIDAFITENVSNNKRSGFYTNLNGKHEFNPKTGRNITLDLDYNQFNTNTSNDLTIYPTEQLSNRSLSEQVVKQPVDIWVVKSDYVHPFDSTFKFETGLKSSFASVDNRLNFFRNGIKSSTESNDFLYKENIFGAYINLSKSLKKFDFNAGVRMENTNVSGTTLDSLVLDRNYLQWFPSASALYHINKNMGIQTSFSRRLNRPGFQQQNPFINFIDSLTYTRGNPKLLPEISNTAQLNFTYDGQPVAGISYAVTNDVIIENAPQIEGTKTYTTAENLANQRRVEIQLNFPIKLGKWLDGYGGNQAIYNSYDATYQGLKYEANQWSWLAYWELNFQLPKDFKLEVGGFYFTKFLEEFLVIDHIGSLDFGASKTFWNKRGKLSFSFNDILDSQNTRANINFNDVNVNFFQRELNRNMRLSFSYQFGNSKVKNGGNRKAASESEASRVKVE